MMTRPALFSTLQLAVSRRLQNSSMLTCMLAAMLLAAAHINAPAQTAPAPLPKGAQVVQGNATFVQTPTQLSVTNSPGSIINWQSFGIAPGHSTYFQQESASSSVLNRVVTNSPSQIFGTLGSNGRVILVNPSGIVVGAGAVVDTAGFTASTLGLVESNAALSRLRFAAGNQTPGSLQVDGIIRSSQGDIILIAPHALVASAGALKASNGTVVLAAGQQVLLTGRGLDGIVLELQAPADQAINLGRLEGNAIGLFASQLRNSGVIQANTAELVGGRVVLRAIERASVSGTVSAAGTGASSPGGVITVEGRDVLLQSASVDASGTAGGGTVLVGGGWQGQDALLTNSLNTAVDSGSRINVQGVGSAGAGTAVVWSDGATRFAGHIDARGGATSGNGGQVEVSGKQHLAFDGQVRIGAPLGVGGSVLLDPKNINVLSTGSNVLGSVSFGQFGTATQTFFGSSLQTLINSAAGGTVTLQASNDVTIGTNLTFSNTAASLNIEAGRTVNINSSIAYAAGNTASLSITANSSSPATTPTAPYRDAGLGAITMAGGTSINMGGAGIVKFVVADGPGGGGAVTLNSIDSASRLIVDNQAVSGGSTGGIAALPCCLIDNITDQIFLRTEKGDIGSAAQTINFKAPLISVSAASGSAYLKSTNPIFLGPVAELGGAAANVSGLLSLDSPQINMGVRGSNAGSGAVTAGQLQLTGGDTFIYSGSPNASGALLINVGGVSSPNSVELSAAGTVSTTLTVGAGGIAISGLLQITGSSVTSTAPAFVSSLGDVQIGNLAVGGNVSSAGLLVNGTTGLLNVSNSGFVTNINVQGGSNSNASALVSAKSIVLGTTTGSSPQTNLDVFSGSGNNASAEVVSTVGSISVYSANLVRVDSFNAGTSSHSLLAAQNGSINMGKKFFGNTDIAVRAGFGLNSPASIKSLQGINIDATTVSLLGGDVTLATAGISSSGPINITATTGTGLTGGTGNLASAIVASGSDTSIIGPLTLKGGSGESAMALVSTTSNITAPGPITFDTSVAGTGSHALMYAGGNGIAFTIAGGPTPTLAVNASSTAAPLSGVIVPPADIAISVVLPPSGLPGSTVSATVTFSNPGIITTTFTPTLVVDGITTTFAPVTLAPNTTLTTVTTVLLGLGTSTTVAADTGKTSWPEVNKVNNTASAVVSLVAGASDLQAFVFLPASAIAGTTVSATVTFVNLGPSANTFTPTVVVNGVTQTLAPVTLPSGGTFTTAINVPVGTAGAVFSAAGTSTVADPAPGNNLVTANVVSLLSDISTAISLPGTANASTTVSGIITFTNLGAATTTFSPLVGVGGVTQTLSSVTLAPGGVFTTTVAVPVGAAGNSLTAGVSGSTVPDSTPGNNAGSAFVAAFVPPPPPPPPPEPQPTPTVTVTVPPPTPTPTVEVTTPTPTPVVVITVPVPTPTVIVTTPTPTPVVVVTPPPVPTPTVIVTTPAPTPVVVITVPVPTPSVVVTQPVPTPSLVVTTPPVTVPALEQPPAEKMFQVTTLLLKNQILFDDIRQTQLRFQFVLPLTGLSDPGELLVCPR